jgi:hypothetical protein
MADAGAAPWAALFEAAAEGADDAAGAAVDAPFDERRALVVIPTT